MLKTYTEAFGVSGCEKEIREIIIKNLEGIGQHSIDKLGNLIVHKPKAAKKVMLAAHMDEVGFMVKRIKEDGRIAFMPVGGIDPRILISKRVYFKRSNIKGVIGAKPIHIQGPAERSNPIPVKELFIDIGATSKDEAKKYVKIGDYATFDSSYVDMGEFIKSKALDDRVGCAIITELLKEDFNFDLYGAFTVQEEVGLRGSGPVGYAVNPELALIIEGTTCADIAEDEKDFVTTSGNGPAISVIDATSIANRKLLRRISEVAEKNNIPFQYRRGRVGGNDAGKISKAKDGCITCTISVPTRYIHSPISMINKKDYENTLKLVRLVLKSLEEGDL